MEKNIDLNISNKMKCIKSWRVNQWFSWWRRIGVLGWKGIEMKSVRMNNYTWSSIEFRTFFRSNADPIWEIKKKIVHETSTSSLHVNTRRKIEYHSPVVDRKYNNAPWLSRENEIFQVKSHDNIRPGDTIFSLVCPRTDQRRRARIFEDTYPTTVTEFKSAVERKSKWSRTIVDVDRLDPYDHIRNFTNSRTSSQ